MKELLVPLNHWILHTRNQLKVKKKSRKKCICSLAEIFHLFYKKWLQCFLLPQKFPFGNTVCFSLLGLAPLGSFFMCSYFINCAMIFFFLILSFPSFYHRLLVLLKYGSAQESEICPFLWITQKHKEFTLILLHSKIFCFIVDTCWNMLLQIWFWLDLFQQWTFLVLRISRKYHSSYLLCCNCYIIILSYFFKL